MLHRNKTPNTVKKQAVSHVTATLRSTVKMHVSPVNPVREARNESKPQSAPNVRAWLFGIGTFSTDIFHSRVLELRKTPVGALCMLYKILFIHQ